MWLDWASCICLIHSVLSLCVIFHHAQYFRPSWNVRQYQNIPNIIKSTLWKYNDTPLSLLTRLVYWVLFVTNALRCTPKINHTYQFFCLQVHRAMSSGWYLVWQFQKILITSYSCTTQRLWGTCNKHAITNTTTHQYPQCPWTFYPQYSPLPFEWNSPSLCSSFLLSWLLLLLPHALISLEDL